MEAGSSSLLIWFKLVDKSMNPFQDATPTTVLRASLPVPIVDRFRKAVHAEYAAAELKDIAAAKLKVFKDETAFKDNEPLLPNVSITAELGTTMETALLVMVPRGAVEPSILNVPNYKPPENPVLEFPFFESNGEDYLTLLGRDAVVNEINKIILPDPASRSVKRPKYWPIVISTSRGMGKTFLLKMIGMQKLEPDLRCVLIEEAICCGRVLSFDFSKMSSAIQNVEDVFTFFRRLMVFFLCRMFRGTDVDGIYFESFSFTDISGFVGKQERFNEWLRSCFLKSTDDMMDEYIRLTNIAFGTKYDVPPVFLLDEIQKLCIPTTIISKFDPNGKKCHTLLSLLLTELAGKHKPICICTGTNNGNIISITETSTCIPQVLSLTPLVNDYMEYWTQMTDHQNTVRPAFNPVKMEGDETLITSLVYYSYQIPRLLFIAHQVWFQSRSQGVTNRESYVKEFEKYAIQYYREMASVLNRFTVREIAHIILSCGVHYCVGNAEITVPGTDIEWSALIQQSIIFPYMDNCFIFPFRLIWSFDSDVNTTEKKSEIEEYCSQLIPNLDIQDLFASFDTLCGYNLHSLGTFFESLFVSSLAVKFYLWSINNQSSGSQRSVQPSFGQLYDFTSESSEAYKELRTCCLDLSDGIVYPQKEATVRSRLPNAVIHNRNHHNAHHDIIIPTNHGAIPVSAKASFALSDKSTIRSQLEISRRSNAKVKTLIWLYLGDRNEEIDGNVVFLNGSGVCNGLALDLFELLKKLKSENNLPM